MMNSTLKPVLAAAGVPQGGQASPAKGNVAGVNHAGHPQGAQNSLHHAPSLAPVSANMAQMAQNMSHHGNLSNVGQNSLTPSNTAASPSKGAGAPLSLVQEKSNASQPLALTRTPEKKEPEASVAQANGTIDSPKPASSAPSPLKPQNPEPNKEKPEIGKASPSTPKPPEKASSAPSTPQKAETSNAVRQADGPSQPKVATANEAPERSPSKPSEPKPTQTADVAPTQTEPKPAPESANDTQSPEKAQSEKAQSKQETPALENKPEAPPAVPQVEEKPKPEEPKPEKPVVAPPAEKKVEEKELPQKKEEKAEPVVDKVEEKKVPEVKTPVVKPPEAAKPAPKSTLKLATVTPPVRKKRQASPNRVNEGQSSAKKPAETVSTPDPRSKRNRIQVQLYQSPTPELTMATKLSASAGRSTPTKPNDDKLIVFYKNEYLAVRNAEGGFYVCQSMQNVYRTTRKIKIRWLSQDKSDTSGETYKPDFYDVTDMECVLTTLSLSRAGGGGAQQLKAAEAARASSILQRALRHERGDRLQLTEEHPDGLDLSLYKDESQLDKKSRKRNSSKSSPRGKQPVDNDSSIDEPSPPKKAKHTPKKSPKSARKAKQSPKTQNKKRKSTAGSTPSVAPTSKTATVTEKATPTKSVKSTPVKKAPAKVETPVSTPRGKSKRNVKDTKPSPIVPTPSTSTGKTTRTSRKPPVK